MILKPFLTHSLMSAVSNLSRKNYILCSFSRDDRIKWQRKIIFAYSNVMTSNLMIWFYSSSSIITIFSSSADDCVWSEFEKVYKEIIFLPICGRSLDGFMKKCLNSAACWGRKRKMREKRGEVKWEFSEKVFGEFFGCWKNVLEWQEESEQKWEFWNLF